MVCIIPWLAAATHYEKGQIVAVNCLWNIFEKGISWCRRSLRQLGDQWLQDHRFIDLWRLTFWNNHVRTRDRSSSPDSVKNFHFSILSRPAMGSTQPPVQRVLGVLSLGVRRQGREADRSPRSNVEVKQTWMYPSTHPYSMAQCLIKHKDL
jgi:hypothetical protein